MSATAKKFDITKHEEFIFDGFRIGITPILRDIQDGIQTNCGLHAFYIEIGTVNNVVDHEHYGGIATKYSAATGLTSRNPLRNWYQLLEQHRTQWEYSNTHSLLNLTSSPRLPLQ